MISNSSANEQNFPIVRFQIQRRRSLRAAPTELNLCFVVKNQAGIAGIGNRIFRQSGEKAAGDPQVQVTTPPGNAGKGAFEK